PTARRSPTRTTAATPVSATACPAARPSASAADRLLTARRTAGCREDLFDLRYHLRRGVAQLFDLRYRFSGTSRRTTGQAVARFVEELRDRHSGALPCVCDGAVRARIRSCSTSRTAFLVPDVEQLGRLRYVSSTGRAAGRCSSAAGGVL